MEVGMWQVSPLCSAPEDAVQDVQRQSEASENEALRFAVDRGLQERERAAEHEGRQQREAA